MTEDLVSYDLAKALQSAGFDWPCDRCYARTSDGENELIYMTVSSDYNKSREGEPPFLQPICSAPALAHAQKWLREKKELCVTAYAQPYNGLPYYTGYILFNGDEKEVLDQEGHWFDDYEKCLSETISAALELITKGE